jgi:proteasome accessory factor C
MAPEGSERLIRLLAMLAYLSEVGDASLEELSLRFGIDERSLVRQLELAACCGLPPYTPDELLELVIDDGRVYAFGLDALRRPPRLTPHEGFALAASARALLAVGGDAGSGPLAAALSKLEAALGASRVGVEIDASEHLEELRRAADRREVVEIDYLGAAKGERTTRRIEPFRVIALEGTFYVDAFCRLANDWRRFHLQRILRVEVTGELFRPKDPPEEFRTSHAFVGGPRVKLAEIVLSREQAELVERFASGVPTELDDGRVKVRIEVGDPEWFGRLLLRVGPGAEVLRPPELRDAASQVARRALKRYGQTAS